MKSLIFEMAIPLKDYKNRVDGLRFQLVENWCLCKYCSLFDQDNPNFNHWKVELRAAIKNLKMVDIKNDIDKHKTITKMLIDDYDYSDYHMILRIIDDKFDDEHINDWFKKERVSIEFSKNVNELIDVISNNDFKINDYMNKKFL